MQDLVKLKGKEVFKEGKSSLLEGLKNPSEDQLKELPDVSNWIREITNSPDWKTPEDKWAACTRLWLNEVWKGSLEHAKSGEKEAGLKELAVLASTGNDLREHVAAGEDSRLGGKAVEGEYRASLLRLGISEWLVHNKEGAKKLTLSRNRIELLKNDKLHEAFGGEACRAEANWAIEREGRLVKLRADEKKQLESPWVRPNSKEASKPSSKEVTKPTAKSSGKELSNQSKSA